MRYVIIEKAYKKPRTTVNLKVKTSSKPKKPKTEKKKGKVRGMTISTGQSF